MIKPPSQQEIKKCLRTHFGISVEGLIPLLKGADPDALSFKADTANQSYFVKVTQRPHCETGPRLLEFFQKSGVSSTLAPVKTKQGDVFHKLGSFTLLVFPFIKGEGGFDCPLSDSQMKTLGIALRKLHSLRIPEELKPQIKKEHFPNHGPDVHSFLNLQPLSSENDEFAQKTIRFIETHKNEILALIESADVLCTAVKTLSAPFVLCHGDIHAGNVWIQEDGKIWIIDWDKAILAPKERDLMFIGAGIEETWNRRQDEATFYSGYGDTEVNRKLLAYYRYERILEDIAIYFQELLHQPIASVNKPLLFKYLSSIFEPGNVVEMANATLNQRSRSQS